jgi:hypothetical protein
VDVHAVHALLAEESGADVWGAKRTGQISLEGDTRCPGDVAGNQKHRLVVETSGRIDSANAVVGKERCSYDALSGIIDGHECVSRTNSEGGDLTSGVPQVIPA